MGRVGNGQAGRGAASWGGRLDGIFDQLSPAQCAFLSGVLALLAAHGEEALTRSCEMVIARFKRDQAD